MQDTMKCLVFCILIAVISCQERESEEGETTCTAPSVKEGDVGDVTCHFPHDVSTLRPVTLTVELYSPNSTGPTGVLDCSWLSSGAKSCTIQEGYTLNGNVSTTLSLQIAKASQTHVGRYACKMMARSEHPPFKTCTFQLKVPENGPLMAGPVYITRPAPESVSTTSKATNSSHASSARQVANSNVVVIAVVVPTVVVIILVAIVAVVVCYRRRTCCFKKKPTDAEQSPEQKEEAFPLNTHPVSETSSDEDDTPGSKNKDNTDPNIPESDPVKKAAGSDDHDDDNDDDDDKDHDDDKDDDDAGDVDVNKRGNTEASGNPTGEHP